MNPDSIKALRGPILVLGAGGFVGANLVLHLRKHRSDVFSIVRKRPAWRLIDIPDESILEVDLTDESAAKNLVDQTSPQTIFDCVSYGGYSFEEDIQLIHRTNYLSPIQFIEILARKPFSAYIHAGSSSEYGTNSQAPSEDSQLLPNSQYAVSKAGMAHYIHYAGTIRGLPCVNLRLYSVYGPLEDTARLIPTLVYAAIQGNLPPLVNPDISRDFVYIDDVCAAFVEAAIRINPTMYGKSYNIGTGARTAIRELVDIARSIFAISAKPQFGSMQNRKWDLAEWYANPTLAAAEFGWKAEVLLADGLARTRQWVESVPAHSFLELTKNRKSNRKRSVSAIIACYRDEQAIPVMHERLTTTFKKINCDYEIIFVNDCSPDNSAEIIRTLSERDPHVLGITHSRNFGSQMAFRSGMELSTKDSVVLLDGDLQDPPELIEQLHQQWALGFDVVYGRRIKREMSLFWGLLYKSFYRVFAAFSYVKIPHDAGDFSLMDRRIVGWLLTCPERDLFMRGLRAYVGFKQTGVDYIRPERMFGRSTNNLWKNIGWAKKGIFAYSNTPLSALSAAGALLFVASLFIALIVIGLRLFMPDIAPRGATTIIICILFFGSINLLSIGILGEYIGKIMEEVKQRPRFIRAAIIRQGSIAEIIPDGSVRR